MTQKKGAAPRSQRLEDLQKKWYRLLELDGFIDIEKLPDSSGRLRLPVEALDSNGAVQQPLEPMRTSFPSPLTSKEEELASREDFLDICVGTIKSGSFRLTTNQVSTIWHLYIEGRTMRSIGQAVGVSKDTVCRIVRRLKDYTILLSSNGQADE